MTHRYIVRYSLLLSCRILPLAFSYGSTDVAQCEANECIGKESLGSTMLQLQVGADGPRDKVSLDSGADFGHNSSKMHPTKANESVAHGRFARLKSWDASFSAELLSAGSRSVQPDDAAKNKTETSDGKDPTLAERPFDMRNVALLGAPVWFFLVAVFSIGIWSPKILTGERECRPLSSRVGILMSFIWAFALGFSCTVSLRAQRVLNQRSDEPDLHCLWVAFIIRLTTLPLLSPSFFVGPPMRRAKLTDISISGQLAVGAFILIVASRTVGAAAVVSLYAVGHVTVGLVVDAVGQLHDVSVMQNLGVAKVLFGAVLLLFARPSTNYGVRGVDFLVFVLVACVGAGSVLQARCNLNLKESLMHPARVAFVSNIVTCLLWAPLLILAWTPLEFQKEDWLLWLFCIIQELCFTASMVEIPHYASEWATRSAVVFGMLVAGLLIDALSDALSEQTSPSPTHIVARIAGALMIFIAVISALPAEKTENNPELQRQNSANSSCSSANFYTRTKKPVLVPVSSDGEDGEDSLSPATRKVNSRGSVKSVSFADERMDRQLSESFPIQEDSSDDSLQASQSIDAAVGVDADASAAGTTHQFPPR